MGASGPSKLEVGFIPGELKADDDNRNSNALAYGVKTLYEPADGNADFEIVAIHGLNGHREESWMTTVEDGSHARRKSWLQELLPLSFPNARIQTYGYDCATNGGSHQELFGHGQDLVVKLALARGQSSANRPIIFLAHCVGGIVLKLALLEASRAHDDHLRTHLDIRLSTCGIIFFGTPHQGLDTSMLEITSTSNNSMLRQLMQDSEYLQNLQTMFSPLSGFFDIKYLYETRALSVHATPLVPKSSAVVPGAANSVVLGLNRDHVSLVQFQSDDEDLRAVVALLQDMMVQSHAREVPAPVTGAANVDIAAVATFLKACDKFMEAGPTQATTASSLYFLVGLSNLAKGSNNKVANLLGDAYSHMQVAADALLKADLERARKMLQTPEVNPLSSSLDIQKRLGDFGGFLKRIVLELETARQDRSWKAVLEDGDDKAVVESAVQSIVERTAVFEIEVMIGIERDLSQVKDVLEKLFLHNWLHSDRAQYGVEDTDNNGPPVPADVCAPETRQTVIERITNWIDNPNSAPVFWMVGPAGAGKSTIARTIAQGLVETKDPLSPCLISFFCSRLSETTSKQVYIIPTITYQLAWRCKPFASELLTATTMPSMRMLQEQMEMLFIQPWARSGAKRSSTLPPFVVIVDALDEVDGGGGYTFLKQLFDAVEGDEQLLKGVKFLVTSRPEPKLAALCRSKLAANSMCDLFEIPMEEVDDDILKYLRDQLPMLTTPSDKTMLRQLAKKSDGHFIYAATAVRYANPREGTAAWEQRGYLQEVIEQAAPLDGTELIDDLYQRMLITAFSGLRGRAFQYRLDILHTVMCTQERVPFGVLAELLDEKGSASVQDVEEVARDIVKQLYSVFFVKDDHIFWYHASFPDFLFAKTRSNFISPAPVSLTSYKALQPPNSLVKFHCSSSTRHVGMLRQTLRMMDTHQLRFNVTGVRSSKDVSPEYVSPISQYLKYACVHWATHLSLIPPAEQLADSRDIAQAIARLLRGQALYWMEVMCALSRVRECGPALVQASQWVSGIVGTDTALVAELQEAANMVSQFAKSPVGGNAAHLYLSMLATLAHSPLTTGWKKRFTQLPRITPVRNTQSDIAKTHSLLSPYASYAVSISGSQFVRWDIDEIKPTIQLSLPETNQPPQRLMERDVAMSSHGSVVAALVNGSIWLWSAPWGAGECLGPADTGPIAMSVDGLHLLYALNGAVLLQDLSTRTSQSLPPGICTSPFLLSLSNDLHVALVKDRTSRAVTICHISEGIWSVEALLAAEDEHITSIAISYSGELVVAGTDTGSTVAWNVATKKIRHYLFWDLYDVQAVTATVLSEDMTFAASGTEKGCVLIWSIINGERIRLFSFAASPVTSLSFFGAGNMQMGAVSADGTVRILHVNYPLTQWKLDYTGSVVPYEDGWWSYDKILLWLPPNIASSLHTDGVTKLLCSKGAIELDIADCHFGEDWAKCYSGEDSTQERKLRKGAISSI